MLWPGMLAYYDDDTMILIINTRPVRQLMRDYLEVEEMIYSSYSKYNTSRYGVTMPGSYLMSLNTVLIGSWLVVSLFSIS